MKREKLTRFFIRLLPAMIFAAGVFGSCVNDDIIECPPEYNVRLVVRTDFEVEGRTRASAGREWYDGQIDDVALFVFDENNRLVESSTGGKYTMGEDYLFELDLEEGHTYSFVAWTNSASDGGLYSITRGDSEPDSGRDDMTMDMNVDEGTIIREDIPHRHYGALNDIEIMPGDKLIHTVVISPQTYRVNFFVRGYSPAHEMQVTDRNVHHSFDAGHRQGAGDPTYHHRRELVPTSGNEESASMILLQIGDDTNTSFEVLDSEGEEIFIDATGDLLETIMDVYELETTAELAKMLDEVYEYDIIITFTGDTNSDGSLAVDIDVKAWNYEKDPVEL